MGVLHVPQVRCEWTIAMVIRVGPSTSHVIIPAWMHGQVALSVPTDQLLAATGLDRGTLAGVVLDVRADTVAVLDSDVRPSGWRLATERAA